MVSMDERLLAKDERLLLPVPMLDSRRVMLAKLSPRESRDEFPSLVRVGRPLVLPKAPLVCRSLESLVLLLLLRLATEMLASDMDDSSLL